jgi:transcriptional regulator with XRE-family HTH domain
MNDKLWKARILRSLSQNDVCKAVGADIRSYQRWEKGESIPQPYYRRKLCIFFGMTPDELGFNLLETLLAQHVSEKSALDPKQVTTEIQQDETPVYIPGDLLEIGVLALRIAQQQHGWNQKELEEKAINMLNHEQKRLSHRDLNKLLASLPVAAFALSSVPEEVLPFCEANLITAWKLARGKDLALAQGIVNTYLPKLRPLAEQNSAVQGSVAQIVAKSHILNGLISIHLGDLLASQQHCLQAIKYAEISGDKDVETIARRWFAWAHLYTHDSAKVLQEYQHASSYLNGVAPLVRSAVLVETALVQAQTGRRQEAFRFVKEAHESFFAETSEDQNNLYMDQDIGVLTLWSGMTYYHLGENRQAFGTLQEIDGLHPKQPVSERIRLHMLIQQALALLRLNELEQAVIYLKAGTARALALDSKLCYNEALKAYQMMSSLHGNEPQVLELKPLFLPFL